MTPSVLFYHDAMKSGVSFARSSIFLDACLILSFLDHHDRRHPKVLRMFRKWKRDRIEKIGISSCVFAEVVHNLFLIQIKSAMALQRKQTAGQTLTPYESHRLGSARLTHHLIQLHTQRMNQHLPATPSALVKQVKKMPHLRDSLTHHYNLAVSDFSRFLRMMIAFGFHVEFPRDHDVLPLASSYIRLFQLDAYDALHLAVSTSHQYDYLATLDNDFVHDFYTRVQICTRILKIA